MFRLRDMKNGMYQIHSKRYGAFEGTPKSIFTQAVRWGVFEPDLRLAVNELHKNGHDYAEFGIFGRFIFTAQDKGKKGMH